MSFVRLIDLRRTTSFRLAVIFLGIFGCISILLFSYLYVAIAGFETQRIDDWLQREDVAMKRSTPDKLAALFSVLGQSDPDRQRPNGLFKTDGTPVAGVLTTVSSHVPYFEKPFSIRLKDQPGTPMARCIARRFADGQFAMRCQNARELDRFNRGLLTVLIVGAFITVAVGFLGAAFIGLGSLRRLDAVTDSIKRIVAGDLSQRLPTHRRHDDLESLVNVVNGMLDNIERLMTEVKGVCDAIAHDLRTPLTRQIAGIERVLRRARTTDDYRQALDDTFVEANGMLRTFNALLRISEIESGARRASFARVNLATVVADVHEYYEPSSEEKSLDYRCDIDKGDYFWLQGDSNLLFEALANLVENAIKFAPVRGQIRIALRHDQHGMRFCVRDNGPGIPESEHKAVLRRFYRGETSRHTPGNGLGLSLAHAIATMHGMTLAFERVATGCQVSLSKTVSGIIDEPGQKVSFSSERAQT